MSIKTNSKLSSVYSIGFFVGFAGCSHPRQAIESDLSGNKAFQIIYNELDPEKLINEKIVFDSSKKTFASLIDCERSENCV